MEIVKKVEDVRNIVKQWRKQGFSVGFVPTMGFLHEGHQSLIERAVKENDKVVVSIFVNPIQFAPNEDFESYPRNLEKDALICEKAGAKLIFNPEPDQMYNNGFCTFVDMDNLTQGLCGKTRPTHFRGVCTIVSKLFNIVKPDKAYFGQKDAQQLCVIKRMVNDLNIDVKVIGCPIIREDDGLAKSSRNTYLNQEERKEALCLFQALNIGKEMINHGQRNTSIIIKAVEDRINIESLSKIDYVEIVDLDSLEKVERIEKGILMAIAVYIGKTRLIDNFMIESIEV